MLSCARRLQFCAGHRIAHHENKCAFLHGHNYVALIHAVAPQLDDLGRVIDFSVLKERIGTWIDTHWDHGFLLAEDDYEARDAVKLVVGQKLFLMPSNPTAENMARYLLEEIAPQVLVGTTVKIVKVELWETENCFAVAALEHPGAIAV
jgi:6-pyruvoyltetrahydropterin/6-carboxytetrahydropterin synthase